jgi:hypothetical protein
LVGLAAALISFIFLFSFAAAKLSADRLLENLSSTKSSEERRVIIENIMNNPAIRLFGNFGYDVAADPLTKALNNYPDQRFFAEIALATIGDHRAVMPLIEVLNADGWDGPNAANILAAFRALTRCSRGRASGRSINL